ncbi:MAG: hypothetical protein R3D53_04530 [Paracoccaceae bacterium]
MTVSWRADRGDDDWCLWRWTGEAVRVDGPQDVLILTGAEGEAEMRRRGQNRAPASQGWWRSRLFGTSRMIPVFPNRALP